MSETTEPTRRFDAQHVAVWAEYADRQQRWLGIILCALGVALVAINPLVPLARPLALVLLLGAGLTLLMAVAGLLRCVREERRWKEGQGLGPRWPR